MAAKWTRQHVNLGPVVGWESLTDAERNVVGLVARGLSDREIAAELFVSPHTVATHLKRTFAKLQVRNRVEATLVVLAALAAVGVPAMA